MMVMLGKASIHEHPAPTHHLSMLLHDGIVMCEHIVHHVIHLSERSLLCPEWRKPTETSETEHTEVLTLDDGLLEKNGMSIFASHT